MQNSYSLECECTLQLCFQGWVKHLGLVYANSLGYFNIQSWQQHFDRNLCSSTAPGVSLPLSLSIYIAVLLNFVFFLIVL